MKRLLLILFAVGTFTTAMTSCRDNKDAGDKVEDAADDVGDAVDDAADDVEDAVD